MVVVSFRCAPLLRDCLESLRRNPPSRQMTVQVIDNASGDGSAEMVARDFPEVHLIANRENRGFSVASNMGIRSGNAPYVLCLNPDTRVTAGALDPLLELMDKHPEVGIAGCRLELEDGRFDHAAKRRFPTPLSALGHFTGLGASGNSSTLAAYRAPNVKWGPVDAVNGAFMMIRRTALDEVGLFDEGYWMYMEDLDLCYRFAQAGWTTWYEPSVTAIHVKGATAGPYRAPHLNYAFHYGMLRFYRKHYAATRSPVTNLAVYVGIATKLGISLVRNAIARSIGPSSGP